MANRLLGRCYSYDIGECNDQDAYKANIDKRYAHKQQMEDVFLEQFLSLLRLQAAWSQRRMRGSNHLYEHRTTFIQQTCFLIENLT